MPIINLFVSMLKTLLLAILAVSVLSVAVPCTTFGPSKNGNASDCSIVRVDGKTIQWGAVINFKLPYNWQEKSIDNVLADMGSPRLPINPDKSQCTTKTGSYKAGDKVLVNCTQVFSAIPAGYSNVITAFADNDYTLGFSTKIPLSFEEEGNLVK